MEGIIIKTITNRGNRLDIDFQISSGLEKYFLPEHHFFAEYSCDISDVPNSVLVVPLLANLVPFSWIVDCIVWIDEVDKSFYDSVPKLKYAFREMYPKTFFGGSLIAAKQINNSYTPQNEALLLFTGGIDATATFLRILDKKPILLNTNGWFKTHIEENEVYNADRNAIEAIAKEHNVSSCFVRSNFATFIRSSILDKEVNQKIHTSWWFGFQHSLAFLGCASIVGFKNKVAKLYIASSYTFGQHICCASDPRTDTCFSCSSMITIHDAYELSRQDKVRYILQQKEQNNINVRLRVCSFNDHNCCACEKCFRSMLAIASEGGDVREFGFELPDTFLNCLKSFLKKDIMELDSIHIVFWYDILARMKENYDLLLEKDVYAFLSTFDFEKAKKDYLHNYYTKNFWSILKRKFRNLIGK